MKNLIVSRTLPKLRCRVLTLLILGSMTQCVCNFPEDARSTASSATSPSYTAETLALRAMSRCSKSFSCFTTLVGEDDYSWLTIISSAAGIKRRIFYGRWLNGRKKEVILLICTPKQQ